MGIPFVTNNRCTANIQNLIKNSELLYLDPNKNRTNNWLMQLRVQFPSRQPPFGSIGTISFDDDGVNIQGKTLQDLGGTTNAKTSGPVSGANSPRIDSKANTDLRIEETTVPSKDSILESSENSNNNFTESDTDTKSQPYSTGGSEF